jgi:hypothetical protein
MEGEKLELGRNNFPTVSRSAVRFEPGKLRKERIEVKPMPKKP